MSEKQELAMCGCRCDLCKAYELNVEQDDQRKTLAEMWNKYYGLDFSLMDSCGGCRSNPSDTDCPVRKCVLKKELNHCGDCGDFPCGVFYQRCGSFSDEKKKDYDIDEYNEYILAYDNETRLKEYKAKRERLKKVSEETMRFMRGKYVLDEVAGKYYDIDCLKFRQGKKTILSINIHEDRYDFQVIFGKVEREKFEARSGEFSQEIQDIYGNSKTYHDGKWMMIPVADLETLNYVKKMIMIKKKPNRKPFPKEQAVYGDCGHRCDLCVHYGGGTINEDFRKELQERVRRVYGLKPDEEFLPCNGCSNGGITGKFDCDQIKCAKDKGVPRCMDCAEYDCGKASVGWKPAIEARSISADDVTWAILPYVDGQYGN